MNQDEQVDIVDENDEIVSKATKAVAHNEGLLHRTVIAEVIASDGSLTLVRQTADRQDPGQFVSPIGGHVEADESEDEAIKREAEEEFGLKGEIKFKLIGKRIYNREVRGRKENHYFILYEIYSDQKPVLNDESDMFERFTKEELSKQIKENPSKFGAAFHFVIKEFYPEIGR